MENKEKFLKLSIDYTTVISSLNDFQNFLKSKEIDLNNIESIYFVAATGSVIPVNGIIDWTEIAPFLKEIGIKNLFFKTLKGGVVNTDLKQRQVLSQNLNYVINEYGTVFFGGGEKKLNKIISRNYYIKHNHCYVWHFFNKFKMESLLTLEYSDIRQEGLDEEEYFKKLCEKAFSDPLQIICFNYKYFNVDWEELPPNVIPVTGY
ncbi:MAG: hypothetical protein NZZ41_04175 [Candidatus Dojkabacteria bacterium]|nr:hypothetical protein [Candidatus Dojkabacteria bacterium]